MQHSSTSRLLILLFGIFSYVLFLLVVLYAIGFLNNMLVPYSIDFGREPESFETSVLINLLLLGLFGVQHSVMARPGFKRWWTRIIPQPIERSIFVLLTNLILILTFWQWRPMPEIIWSTDSDLIATMMIVLFWTGWGIVLLATFQIDHFDLFGLRQVGLHFQERPYTSPKFMKRGLYRYVRHPIMLGFLLAFWATPDMTEGRLLFAMTTTLYVLIAIHFEEKDLVAMHGEVYEEYQSSVSMLIPLRFEPDDELDTIASSGR